MDLTERIRTGRAVVTAQIELLLEGFGESVSHWKHDGTRVTEIDLRISERVFAALGAAFPDDDLCSEEGDPAAGPRSLESRYCWILDPVDGTNNFAIGIPMVAISLALLEDGEPVYGFVYDLGGRRLHHGGPGRGLWVDDQRIEPGIPEERDARIVALHSPIDGRHLPLLKAILRKFKIRAYGSGALHLTHVAYGRIDACLDFTIKVWDIAAAVAFCRESGTAITFFQNNPFPVRRFDVRMRPTPYLAASPAIHQEMLRDMPIPGKK
ncbi:MAG: inositol monophosphatase [Opitutaceae bacterium]